MYVKEFEITPLTKKLLRYTDEDTDDRELLYTITSPPTELSPINPLENPGTLITICNRVHLVILYNQEINSNISFAFLQGNLFSRKILTTKLKHLLKHKLTIIKLPINLPTQSLVS